MKNAVILVAALLMLSGCSVFSPVKSQTPTTYLINATPWPATHRTNKSANLLVNQPDGIALYNSTGIAYTSQPYQIGYFVKSTWAEQPTQMLQPMIIQTLRRTHYFNLVGNSASLSQYNYVLYTHLLLLQEDFSRTPHLLHFVLRAEVVNASTNEILASKDLSADEFIARNDTYTGVIATNRAAARIMNQLAAFAVKTVQNAN